MISSRWWLVALTAVSATSIALLVFDGAPDSRAPVQLLVAGCAILLVYNVIFLGMRRHVAEGNRAALAIGIVTIVFTGSLTALLPSLATMQFFAYPLQWVVAGSRRRGIWLSAVLAVAVGIGFWFSFGSRVEALPMILGTQALSFVFSLVMGLWISHIAELGEKQAKLVAELQATQSELAALHRDAGVTAERSRMSREVHDTVAQSLTGLVLLTQRTQREFEAHQLTPDTLRALEQSAQDALTETRSLVAASAPVELAHGGLTQALTLLTERFERETRIRVTVHAEVTAPLERDHEVVLLRCAQEGLANVRKHAAASAAQVTLTVDDGAAQLSVTDDGRGFGDDAPTGFGLDGLRDRLALANGTLEVDGTPGATTLTASIPRGGAS